MKLSHLLSSSAAALVLSLAARADLIEQFVAPPPHEATPCVWFQALKPGGMPALDGHSGMLSLGNMPFGSSLYGGWLTFTPGGTFLVYEGAGSVHEIFAPGSGAKLDDVRGALKLGEAYGVIVDTNTGAILAATLYSGALIWTSGHTYLLLVGGVPTTYEFTDGGAPIAGVRGGTLLGSQIIDTDHSIGVAATLFSGSLVYTGSKTYQLTTFGLGIGATEVLSGGASLGGVRGVAVMGGTANEIAVNASALMWTPGKTLCLTTLGGPSVVEVLDPVGASIANTWGITRQSPASASLFTATVITDTRELFVSCSAGALSTLEVLQPGGASIATGVTIPVGAPMLRQASGLSEFTAQRFVPSGRLGLVPIQGTVIGAQQ